MALKATPLRSCRVCRAQRSKRGLTRWVLRGSERIRDEAQRLPGRGYYTCGEACAAKLRLGHIKNK